MRWAVAVECTSQWERHGCIRGRLLHSQCPPSIALLPSLSDASSANANLTAVPLLACCPPDQLSTSPHPLSVLDVASLHALLAIEPIFSPIGAEMAEKKTI